MKAIAAITKNGVMGQHSSTDLPWERQRDDMQWFRKMTTDKSLVVGPKTYQSIRALPRRQFEVVKMGDLSLTCEGSLRAVWDISMFDNGVPDLLQSDDFFLAGGGWLYGQLLPECTELYLTVFDFELDLGKDALYFPYTFHALNQMFPYCQPIETLEKGTIFLYRKR